ncbi:hypothetical protein HHK36_006983 [Tetracentron sinense]|uniref:BRO1 domain-containing protein n=1 Tax=Tetracentron sinense TaxID=13715 RepID=A0A834ZIZ4_TETSI|nr:hypothetical protein HHK36_006983 [Tetracentron sinense]
MMLHFSDPVKLKTKKWEINYFGSQDGFVRWKTFHVFRCRGYAQVVFEEIYIASDCGTLEQLKELSSRRRAIEESINGSSFITEAIAREMAGGLTSQHQQDLQKLEQYLPLLQNLVTHADLVSSDPQMVHWTPALKIRWTSALTASSVFNLMGPKFFHIDNLRSELGMTLFLYGAILRERAFEVLSADLVQSATLYRKAAGVYHYLAHELLPSVQPALALEIPPEATSSVSSVMSLICLAEAQAVTIRKAEEKGSAGGLLAKLHHGITQLLDEATGVLHSATGECKVISVRFVEFISSCRALHDLRSQKHLAEGIKIADQVGVAVGVLRNALANAKEKMPGEESWHLVFKQEMNGVTEMLRKFEHENEFVWRDKIPDDLELPSPQGKKIVSAIPYHPQRWERELVFRI